MTYIVKTQSDKTFGIYDTIAGSYPIEGPELRAAGIERIEGSGNYGWFKGAADLLIAERIASTLNTFHGLGEFAPTPKGKKAKAVKTDDGMADMAAALIADQS